MVRQELAGMVKAIMLITAEPGAEKTLVNELKSIHYVKEAYEVYGVYDVVVKIEADSMGRLKETVSGKIRRMKNVRSTLTLFCLTNLEVKKESKKIRIGDLEDRVVVDVVQ